MQKTFQDMEDNKKQIIAIVLFCFSIIIGFFFTLDQSYSYMEKKDTLEWVKKATNEQKWVLKKLQIMKEKLLSDGELQKDIERYGGDFREDIIFDSIFTLPVESGISIGNISISKGEKTPNGLSLASITLSFKAQSIYALNNFLTHLTSDKSNSRSYIIKNFNFPIDTTKNEAVSATLSLGMYYFE